MADCKDTGTGVQDARTVLRGGERALDIVRRLGMVAMDTALTETDVGALEGRPGAARRRAGTGR
ncbi:MAG: hypothetical protein OXQ29_06535 [Rhodospirillaceae bacterium]|nr:hypothetical protein [Rhodospirillaceae bacterium]